MKILANSTQHYARPQSLNACQLMANYFEFLEALAKFIKIQRPDLNNLAALSDQRSQRIYFRVRGVGLPLLIFQIVEISPERVRLKIIGGVLNLSDFKPALPWGIYLLTQAKIHTWVMHRFSFWNFTPQSK